MANWNEQERTRQSFGSVPRAGGDVAGVTFDEGLRSYMLSIYNYMGSAVLLTGIVAIVAAFSGFTASVLGTPLQWVIALAPLAFILAISFGLNKMSLGTLQVVFWSFAVAMGLSVSWIFLVYTGPSIAVTFFATAAAFAGLSLFGYTTKKNLSGMGSFLIMGVIGLLVAMVINIFLQSPAMMFAISIIGILIFAGLTAYYTQEIKTTYVEHASHGDQEWLDKAAYDGALSLYIAFLNMFQFLLMFMGQQE